MAKSEPTNLTGFDIRQLKAAARSSAGDPWRRREAWRYTGPFTRFNRFRGTLPGLGTATVAFAAYCTYEYLFLNEDHHEHGGDHGTSEGH